MDSQSAFIVDSSEPMSLRQPAIKDKLTGNLRGHITPQDVTALHKVRSKLYGHMNIGMLENRSRTGPLQERQHSLLKEKILSLNQYQQKIKQIIGKNDH
jgi:hypothetical protein